MGGVEFNRYGKPTGYWVQQYSIDGWQTTEPEFHPAKDVIFYYSKRRPSQLREVSDFAPTISRIRDANEFITAVSVKERIAACLAVLSARRCRRPDSDGVDKPPPHRKPLMTEKP